MITKSIQFSLYFELWWSRVDRNLPSSFF